MVDNNRNTDSSTDGDGTAASNDWDDVHSNALLEYERGYERERNNIDEAYEDLRFRRGRLADQWTPEALSARQGRPCHVVNKLPQFIRQVTGDMRQMRPSIKVVPVDSGADIETAEVRGGIIRYVENRSYAKHVYTSAADSQVTAGIGHWQITTEYADAGTFNQEIRIVGIEDAVAVIWDADSVMPTREDADHCFVPVDMSQAQFKRQWPDAVASGFDVSLNGTGTSGAFDNWHSDDFIRVVSYWKRKPIKRTLALLPDGSIEDLTDQVKDIPKEQIAAGLEWLKSQKQARIEVRDSYKVCRYLMTAGEILEESEWPGMYIPVVPCIGEEVRIGREVFRHGIVRYARDLQRMVNYYASAETEVVALQPKAPWLGTKKQFEQHYDLWETANTDNHPFLEYTPDPQAGGPPSRVQPPVASQAIAQGRINSAEDMKAVIGIYDSSLGAKSNETSGVAIARRDRQGDTGTFVYIDNFALAIQRTGQIVNDLIPHIYDTQRQMRILGEDGKPDMVEINAPKLVDGMERTQHDMTSGSYDVMIEQGPSYSTKREEAKDGMTAFIQAVPAAAGLIGDLYAKSQDWPHAEEIGERLEAMLPPQIQQALQADKQKRESKANNGQPPQPTPEQQQQMAQQQAQEQMQQQAQAMQMAEAAAKVKEAAARAEKMEEDARKAKADADKAEIETQILRAQMADTHMENLRKIEKHSADIEDVLRRSQHAQDKHEVDMTVQGLKARQQHEAHGIQTERERAQMERDAQQPEQVQ